MPPLSQRKIKKIKIAPPHPPSGRVGWVFFLRPSDSEPVLLFWKLDKITIPDKFLHLFPKGVNDPNRDYSLLDLDWD